jgi:hypothetical protein
VARSDETNSPTTAVQPRGAPQERAPTEPSAGHQRIARPLASKDNPRLCSEVKSGGCQQGSQIVLAAFAGLRARLTFISWRTPIPLQAMVQASSTMLV